MELLTAQELARALKVTVDTVWRYTRTGRIPSLRLGDREYRYRLPEVLEALAATPPPLPSLPPFRLTDPAKLEAFAGRSAGDDQP